MGIRVVVGALNGDYKGVAWPSVSNLMPHADNITLQRAVCFGCCTETAIYSHFCGNPATDSFIGSVGK